MSGYISPALLNSVHWGGCDATDVGDGSLVRHYRVGESNEEGMKQPLRTWLWLMLAVAGLMFGTGGTVAFLFLSMSGYWWMFFLVPIVLGSGIFAFMWGIDGVVESEW